MYRYRVGLLCKLNVTAPLTVATAEKTFSKLQIVKNLLKTATVDF